MSVNSVPRLFLQFFPTLRQINARMLIIVVHIAILYQQSCFATSYLIKPDGSGNFYTIQEGCDSAPSGDTILLADGECKYTGNRQIEA